MLNRYQRYVPPLIYAVAAVLVLGYSFEIGRATQSQKDREQIKAANKADDRISRENGGNAWNSRINHPPREPHAKARSDETSKVALLSVPLGEGMLVIVTLMLVGVTYQLVMNGKESAERQLRAYVNVEPLGINPFTPGDFIVGHVAFHNTGQVWAKNVHTFIDIQWSHNNQLKNAFPIDKTKLLGKPFIGPRAKILQGTRPIAPSEINSCGAKGIYLYVWGCVRYDDGFTKGRITKFCHRYPWEKLVPAEGGSRIDVEHARYHGEGNEPDAEEPGLSGPEMG